jgi:hypothetical protein
MKFGMPDIVMPRFERRQDRVDEPEYVASDTQEGHVSHLRQRLGPVLCQFPPIWQTLKQARTVLSNDCRRRRCFFTIAVILLVLWLLGLVSGYTLGNFIYVLLVIALVLFVVGLVSGRRTV